ncbi:MAG TPA: hypothetical protein VLG47_07800 [Candidatus Saccharimonadales bacterium]|nr:hypothetical protein [Candidatus Saccharimonadales bacterium]
MSTAATKEDLQSLIKRSDKQFDVLNKKIDSRFDDMMNVMQTFMHQVDARFTKVESEIVDLKISIDKLTNTLDGFLARLDTIDKENAIRDRQFQRLLEWAHKVSEKTGIPLENL